MLGFQGSLRNLIRYFFSFCPFENCHGSAKGGHSWKNIHYQLLRRRSVPDLVKEPASQTDPPARIAHTAIIWNSLRTHCATGTRIAWPRNQWLDQTSWSTYCLKLCHGKINLIAHLKRTLNKNTHSIFT